MLGQDKGKTCKEQAKTRKEALTHLGEGKESSQDSKGKLTLWELGVPKCLISLQQKCKG